MKTIGMIGGMSWESTITYYQIMNEVVKEELGGLHSAKIIMYSVDFSELEQCLAMNDWDKIREILTDIAKRLEAAGADFIAICTNTMHKVAPQIQEQIRIPILHIADATADALCEDGVKKVGLLGTKYTMTQDFYKDRLTNRGLEVMIPDADDIEILNRIIFDELCLGIIKDYSRDEYKRIIETLSANGAEAVILGCTEIGLLISQNDSKVKLYDTTVV
ncbi:MAG: aspartate/glutamate racemase family protein, partial [Lachnospiraceae bacterium]|nr:aspartate/glutamate racemase family protein [Lachnospiraceae bacterium]